jgi:UDP-2,4-diacetamido-2,4,6-trideoxy-beta-L-altropyranose hydrolase
MKVLIRADASSAIGTGHVMRCLALADALATAGHEVAFASAALPDRLAARISARAFRIVPIDPEHDLDGTLSVASAEGSTWAVIDHYGLDAEWVSGIRAAALRVLLVDDLADRPVYPANLVLNTNAYARRAAYRGRTDARLLVGPRYALLRSEFARYATWQRRTGDARAMTILVTMGGADPAGLTLPAVEALLGSAGLAGHRLLVPLGSANPRAAEVRARLDGIERVELLPEVDDMSALMEQADLAVASAGSTCWELAYMQLPAIMIPIADNQVRVAASLVEAGVALRLDPDGSGAPPTLAAAVAGLAADPGHRAAMSAAGRRLVDGRGAGRVARAMMTADLVLRPATAGDAALLFGWANDAATRAASFRPEPIPWPTHVEWLDRRLAADDCLLLVGEHGEGGEAIGQVRFDRESQDVAVISVSVAPSARGAGYAPALIDAGTRAAFARWPIDAIRAEIRSANVASLASFADAGFGDPGPLDNVPDAVAMWFMGSDDDRSEEPR